MKTVNVTVSLTFTVAVGDGEREELFDQMVNADELLFAVDLPKDSILLTNLQGDALAAECTSVEVLSVQDNSEVSL